MCPGSWQTFLEKNKQQTDILKILKHSKVRKITVVLSPFTYNRLHMWIDRLIQSVVNSKKAEVFVKTAGYFPCSFLTSLPSPYSCVHVSHASTFPLQKELTWRSHAGGCVLEGLEQGAWWGCPRVCFPCVPALPAALPQRSGAKAKLAGVRQSPHIDYMMTPGLP